MKYNSPLYVFAIAIMATLSLSVSAEQDRPNILWLTSEDNSKHWLRIYNENGAAMPNLERLASKSFVFENAFSNAPVCSTARSTLITGCYAPRVGAQYHRRSHMVPMPEGLEMFPYYLRQAGYYTTNNSKKDYNLKEGEIWNASSGKATYRNRQPGQPFFHVQNHGITHEGRLHFSEEEMRTKKNDTSSDEVKIFPYHPDTETFRYTYARYHDLHQQLDEQLGDFLKQIEDDGLSEDTIIFYYGDHGGVLPRGKGYAYESGLNVPLIVYVPEKWRHLVALDETGKVDPFVSFIDFGPTVLNLAGVKVPEQMDGKPFLGKGVTKDDLARRDTAFGYADRFDEKYDLVRVYRKGKFKYMRSYQPFNFDGLFNDYRYKMAAYREWYSLYKAGQLTPKQSRFFQTRLPESLYDIENDPHETQNLAQDPSYSGVLKELRQGLREHLKSTNDLSFFPEPVMVTEGLLNPVQFGEDNKARIARYIDLADLSLLDIDQAAPKLKSALQSKDPWDRYWALISCTAHLPHSKQFAKEAKRIADSDPEPLVRARAAEYLGLSQTGDPVAPIMAALPMVKDEVTANLILNTVTLLRDTYPKYDFPISKSHFDSEWTEDARQNVARRLSYFKR